MPKIGALAQTSHDHTIFIQGTWVSDDGKRGSEPLLEQEARGKFFFFFGVGVDHGSSREKLKAQPPICAGHGGISFRRSQNRHQYEYEIKICLKYYQGASVKPAYLSHVTTAHHRVQPWQPHRQQKDLHLGGCFAHQPHWTRYLGILA